MSGISSQTTVLASGDGASPEVFTAIANVVDFEGPDRDNPEIDVTDLDATAMEFIAGLIDNGEITFTVNFDPADTSHELLLDRQEARTTHNWQLQLPVSPAINWTFPAFVKQFTPRGAVNNPLTASVTLRITGTVTRP